MLVFNYDSENGSYAYDPSGESLVASFLTEDLQSIPTLCDHVLDKLERIQRGNMVSWGSRFEAHAVAIDNDTVILRSLVTDLPDETIPIHTFTEMVSSWTQFISTPRMKEFRFHG